LGLWSGIVVDNVDPLGLTVRSCAWALFGTLLVNYPLAEV
jgi:hypothetical protein